MSIVKKLARKLQRVHCGVDTRTEFLLACIDKLAGTSSAKRARGKRLLNTPHDSEAYMLRDIRLPLVNDGDYAMRGMNIIDEDILLSYIHFNDYYSEKTFDLAQQMLGEGLYSLVNDKVNVTVKPDDIVSMLEAGSETLQPMHLLEVQLLTRLNLWSRIIVFF